MCYYNIIEYNHVFKSSIILNCSCYKDYDKNNFFDYVFKNKNSYFGCLSVEKDGEKGIAHKTIPIMLGSIADLSIREVQAHEIEMFGTFIIKGNFSILCSFSANNLMAGYTYCFKNFKSYKMNVSTSTAHYTITYSPDKPIEIKESSDSNNQKNLNLIRKWRKDKATDESVTSNPTGAEEVLSALITQAPQRKKRKTMTLQHQEISNNEDWVSIINACSPIPEHMITADDYLAYFKAAYEYGPSLDELANKTVISPVLTLERAKNKFLQSADSIQSFKNRFKLVVTLGYIFLAYSNKSKIDQIRGSLNVGHKSVYETVNTNKYNTMSLGLGAIKRNVSSQVKNSKALLFPIDGKGLICPVTTKELKGAGEVVHYTMMTINSMKIEENKVNKLLNSLHNPKGKFRVLKEGFLTNYYLDFPTSKDLILYVKSRLPLAVMYIYDKFVNFLTQGALPLHYSVKYKVFISSFEAKLVTDAFEMNPHILNFSSYMLLLHEFSQKSLYAKLSVAIQNLKGACVTFCSEIHAVGFITAIGYHSGLDHANESIPGYIFSYNPFSSGKPFKVKIITDSELTARFYLQFAEKPLNEKDVTDLCVLEIINSLVESEKHRKITTKQEETGLCYSDFLVSADEHFKKIESIISDYEPNEGLYLSSENVTLNKTRKKKNRYLYDNVELKLLPLNRKRIKLDPYQKHGHHLLLYAAFGDIKGLTTEDGIILDKTFCENGPNKICSVTLIIKVQKIIYKSNKDYHHAIRYTASNWFEKTTGTIYFGILESTMELNLTMSKNVTAHHVKVNKSHQYVICCESITSPIDDVNSEYDHNVGNLKIHYTYKKKLGVGVKLANAHGQKGICSAVLDLQTEQFEAFTKNGKKIYPQVLFHPVSVIGRTQASQIYSQLSSDSLGITRSGMFVGIIKCIIHHKEPPINVNTNKKSDLMTCENGFIGTENGTFLNVMRKQNSQNKTDILETSLELAASMGTRICFNPLSDVVPMLSMYCYKNKIENE